MKVSDFIHIFLEMGGDEELKIFFDDTENSS